MNSVNSQGCNNLTNQYKRVLLVCEFLTNCCMMQMCQCFASSELHDSLLFFSIYITLQQSRLLSASDFTKDFLVTMLPMLCRTEKLARLPLTLSWRRNTWGFEKYLWNKCDNVAIGTFTNTLRSEAGKFSARNIGVCGGYQYSDSGEHIGKRILLRHIFLNVILYIDPHF